MSNTVLPDKNPAERAAERGDNPKGGESHPPELPPVVGVVVPYPVGPFNGNAGSPGARPGPSLAPEIVETVWDIYHALRSYPAASRLMRSATEALPSSLLFSQEFGRIVRGHAVSIAEVFDLTSPATRKAGPAMRKALTDEGIDLLIDLIAVEVYGGTEALVMDFTFGLVNSLPIGRGEAEGDIIVPIVVRRGRDGNRRFEIDPRAYDSVADQCKHYSQFVTIVGPRVALGPVCDAIEKALLDDKATRQFPGVAFDTPEYRRKRASLGKRTGHTYELPALRKYARRWRANVIDGQSSYQIAKQEGADAADVTKAIQAMKQRFHLE